MTLTDDDLLTLLPIAEDAARKAGAFIQASLSKGIDVQHKNSGDNIAAQVVTEVDLGADAMISEILRSTCERYELALLTEEGGDDRSRLEKHAFWSVDPLDGTLGFINARPGYSVSIALVARDGTPLIGVVYNPVTDKLYSAVRGQGAWLNGISWQPLSNSRKEGPFTLVFDHGFERRDYYPQVDAAIRQLCDQHGFNSINTIEGDGGVMNALHVLENAPGCYFKFPKTEEGGGCLWDFAATSAIFHECNASASDYSGRPLALNRAESLFMNYCGVLFASHAELATEVRRLLPVDGTAPVG